MKALLIVALFIFLFSCGNVYSYSVKKEKKILADNKSCKVTSYYPSIQFQGSDSSITQLNKNLEAINEMDRFVGNCSNFFPDQIANKEKEIVGDYLVLFQTDTLLDIEYFVKSRYFIKTEYRNVFISLAKKELMEGDQALPNIDRSKLYPYVKRFSDSTGVNINLKAYEKNSTYSITYGRTARDLVLYLGQEGEFGGYYKISIPINEVLK